jgi:signal peptidase I
MKYIFDIAKVILLALATVIPIHVFVVQGFRVSDSTMTPYFNEGDIVLVDRWNKANNLYRDDYVIFRSPDNSKIRHLRRIIGLPGERIAISDGILTITDLNEVKTNYALPLFGSVVTSQNQIGKLDDHEYYVIGEDIDKEPFGLVDDRFILGKPIIRLWPVR